MACSYSAAPIENFTITNAQAGEYYVILITNYSNQAGTVIFTQTNNGQTGAGTTDCAIVCSVELGTDVSLCNQTSYTITSSNQNADSYAWYNGTTLLTGQTSSTLVVTQAGTYKCVITCGLNTSEDTKTVTFNTSAVRDGKIIATGTNEEILKEYESDVMEDAKGKTVFPGFIDAHAPFVGYGFSLQRVNLVGTESWDAVLNKCTAFAKGLQAGQWLTGRGWDQNDWAIKEFPANDKLNELFPDRPVLITRIDGHAAIANNKALEIAGVKPGDKLEGGEIEVRNGKLTGILVDNAVDLVSAKIPAADEAQAKKALLLAQKNCFATGLTSVHDCGLDHGDVEKIQKPHCSYPG